jgi:hypothetical protein
VNFHWLGWIAVAAGAVSIWLGIYVRVHEADSGANTPATKTNSPLGELPVNPTTLIKNQTAAQTTL